MATPDLARLASILERHTSADRAYDTTVPALRLYRSSSPSELTAVVYEPSLCIVAQGAKMVLLAGQAYRYDSAQTLLVSVDLRLPSSAVNTGGCSAPRHAGTLPPSSPALLQRVILGSSAAEC